MLIKYLYHKKNEMKLSPIDTLLFDYCEEDLKEEILKVVDMN